jgi:hypothetical protein
VSSLSFSFLSSVSLWRFDLRLCGSEENLCLGYYSKGGVPLLMHPHYPTERSDEHCEERKRQSGAAGEVVGTVEIAPARAPNWVERSAEIRCVDERVRQLLH